MRHFIATNPLLFVLDVVSGAATFVVYFAFGLIFKLFFDRLADGDFSAVVAIIVGIILVKLVHVAFGGASVGVDAAFRFKVVAALSRGILRSALERPGALGPRVGIGDMLVRFRTDAYEISNTLGRNSGITSVTSSIAFSVAALIALVSINPFVTVVSVLPTVGVAVLTYLTADRAKRLRAVTREAEADVADVLREAFHGVQAVKIAGAEDDLEARLSQLSARRRDAAIRDDTFVEALASGYETVLLVGTVLVLVSAAPSLADGSFTVGDLVLFMFCLAEFAVGVASGGRFFSQVRQSEVSIKRIDDAVGATDETGLIDVLTRDEEFTDDEGAEPKPFNVEFRMPAGSVVPSVVIEPGSVTVVVGKTGSGKSTLLKQLVGLLPNDTTMVFVDGEQRETLEPRWAAHLPQVPTLFTGSVRDNILAGRRLSDEEIWAHAEFAGFGRDLRSFPEGLDTQVGTQGHRLSGGQVQRLAMTRTLATGSRLYAIDDLSSALDVHTEDVVWSSLLGNLRGVTYIIATNRMRMAARADRVIVLKDGVAVAVGTPAELSVTSPDYRDLVA